MDSSYSSTNGFAVAPGLECRSPSALTTNKSMIQVPNDHRAYNIEPEDGKNSHNDFQSMAWNFNVPFLGRMRILKDKPGLVASSIIVLYWLYGNYSTWFAILIPRYLGGQVPFVLLMIYAAVSALCITSFIRVSTMNPGSLSISQQPQADWNVCQKCLMHRPPNAHHCRRCGHCVRKMDHHCPWVNNCVGEDNQFAFMLLLAYAYTLSIMTLVLDILHLYFMPPCLTCDKDSFVVIHQSVIMWTAVVMAALMTCGAFGLYFGQHISIVFDTPSMEWSRIQQTMFLTGRPPDKWPSQKGSVFSVYRTVCGSASAILWMFPCRRVRPSHQFMV